MSDGLDLQTYYAVLINFWDGKKAYRFNLYRESARQGSEVKSSADEVGGRDGRYQLLGWEARVD